MSLKPKITVEKIAVVVLILLLLVIAWLRFRPAKFKQDVTVPSEPWQENMDEGEVFYHLDYEVTPLASFEMEGLVLGAKHYNWGRAAKLVPVDLALGWGPMSDGRIVSKIGVHQYNRFYHWWTDGQIIDRRDVETHSANMHLIPADGAIAKRIKRAKRGQVVSIKGALVSVKGEDGFTWTSSLTRQDIGFGACELIWVEDFAAWNP